MFDIVYFSEALSLENKESDVFCIIFSVRMSESETIRKKKTIKVCVCQRR